MNTVSPIGRVIPFPAAQSPAAANTDAPATKDANAPVSPVSEADVAKRNLPENPGAEAIVLALNAPSETGLAERVAQVLSTSGMNVVNDGVRFEPETDVFGNPTSPFIAVPDTLPDRVPE